MAVPRIWELNGYGDPEYVNVGFAWRGHFENNPPTSAGEGQSWVPTAAIHNHSWKLWTAVVIAHFEASPNIYL